VNEVPSPQSAVHGRSSPQASRGSALLQGRVPLRLPQGELHAEAREFESVFLHILMKSMRATVRGSRWMGGGRGGAFFSDLFDQSVARSSGGRLGLAGLLANRYGGKVDRLAR